MAGHLDLLCGRLVDIVHQGKQIIQTVMSSGKAPAVKVDPVAESEIMNKEQSSFTTRYIFRENEKGKIDTRRITRPRAATPFAMNQIRPRVSEKRKKETTKLNDPMVEKHPVYEVHQWKVKRITACFWAKQLWLIRAYPRPRLPRPDSRESLNRHSARRRRCIVASTERAPCERDGIVRPTRSS